MKKITQLFLLVIYTAAVLGITVKGFYCCDTLRSVSVSVAGTQKDSKNKQDDGGCFKTKYQVLQVKDNHCAPDLVKTPTSVYTEIASLFYSIVPALHAQTEVGIAYQSHPPPLLNTIPVYLYDCVFRI